VSATNKQQKSFTVPPEPKRWTYTSDFLQPELFTSLDWDLCISMPGCTTSQSPLSCLC